MATFECTVIRYQSEKHPDADRLRIGRWQGYQFITGPHYEEESLGVYIPEGAVVPAKLIEEMELTGKLAGGEKNRVKAVKLRGVLSQGLFYGSYTTDAPGMTPSWNPAWQEGDDVAAEMGIFKYEPIVPVHMAGKMKPMGTNAPIHYDIENIKRFPNLIYEGTPVVMTEKIHGSCCIVGITADGEEFVTSKGLAARGFRLEEEETNVYWRAVRALGLIEKVRKIQDYHFGDSVVLFGEVYGASIQDLGYGIGKGDVRFRAFDLRVNDSYLNAATFSDHCMMYEIPTVPVLYRGPYSREILEDQTRGPSTLAGHIREGLVVRPIVEEFDRSLGRVILKSVSPEYLTRKNGTEFN